MEKNEMMPLASKQESGRLYPERAFLRADKEIERLQRIENGEIKKLELTEDEKEQVFEFENGLGEQLEQVFDIKVNSITIYPEYFLTDAGREEFSKRAGFDVEGGNAEEVILFLYKNRDKLNLLKGKDLSDLAGRTRAYDEEKLLEQLQKKLDKEGNVDFSDIQNPKRVSILLNPENALDKIQKLREFKRKIVKNNNFGTSDSAKAKERIISIYKRRVNELIVGQFNSGVLVKNLAESLGDNELTAEEKGLIDISHGLNNFVKSYSRYDKLIFGAAREYDETKQENQIGLQIQQYADQIEKKYLDNEISKDGKLLEKGLDPKKVFKEDVLCEKFVVWEEQFLEQYNEKSSFPSSEYDPKRKGPAPDGKWQFIADKRYPSMAVDSKQKVIKSGISPKSIAETLGTLLGHENVHFLQAINQPLLKLRLFQKVGGDRRLIFSEGGAMSMEDMVCRDIFGFENIPRPHYIRAMQQKIKGGSYVDCAKAYYESILAVLREKKKINLINEEEFIEEARTALKTAIKSSKRLFHDGDSFESNAPFLTHSKDTVYIEQLAVMDKLKARGLEKYAFIRGANVEMLGDLAEIGLLDPGKMQEFNLDFIRKIWEREKEKYSLDNAETDSEKIKNIRVNLKTLND